MICRLPWRCVLLAFALSACPHPPDLADAGTDAGDADSGIDAGPPDSGALAVDLRRDIVSTDLDVDLSTLTATATVVIATSSTPAVSFEAKGLRVDTVSDSHGNALPFAFNADDAGRLDVAVPVQADPSTVVVTYGFTGGRTRFEGLLAGGSTLTWPYFCSNLFPCHSDPADGVHFYLHVHGNDAGTTVVYPAEIPTDAPSYQLAWATGVYTPLELGATDAGTQVTAWTQPGDTNVAMTGTAHLLAVFDWYEQNLGPYVFGGRVGPVDVIWPPGAYGGMEHHPFWHISNIAFADEVVHAHEAAHGWFGDGVRLRCWEDFLMSEGTVSYLAAHVLGVVEGAAVEQAAWAGYQTRLYAVQGVVAWPDGCDGVDPLATFGDAPYMKTAFFYRALEAKVGAAPLIASLKRFFTAHHGQTAGMQDVLDAVQAETGYDATACAQSWLKSTTLPADLTTCP